MADKTAPECTKCPAGEGKVLPLVYGRPGPELLEKSQRGEVVLGGCIMDPEPKKWACKTCGERMA